MAINQKINNSVERNKNKWAFFTWTTMTVMSIMRALPVKHIFAIQNELFLR